MFKMTVPTLFLLLLLAACQSDPKTTDSKAPELSATEIPESHVSADTIAPVQKEEPETDTETKGMAPPPMKPTKTNTAASSPASGAPVRMPATGAAAQNAMILQNGFAEVQLLDPSIQLDIRYATKNNFTQSKIYDCPRCLLRLDAAEAIVKANKALKTKGLTLKMFDCYRPRPYQQRLWDKVPNPDYVTPPAKGSMHSRGAAVDLTIVNAKGQELDMGTPYDFFGEEAHTDYTRLSAQVLENRNLLRRTLEAVGFKGIRTEWWHFSYQKRNYPLSDYLWPCPDEKE